MLSLTVKKIDVFKFDGVAESDNNGSSQELAKILILSSSFFSPQFMRIARGIALGLLDTTAFRVLFFMKF